ncbi:MAG: RsiV family protein, partial [Bacilli bacterium]|nr:RsiV family protein [Bacilli bacterium]
NQVVTLEDFIKEDSNFLEIVSKNVREQLSKNKKIVSYDMMIQGTTPQIENFSQFAPTDRGYLFFFSPYQVAPYSSGKFQVLLPYSLFEKN